MRGLARYAISLAWIGLVVLSAVTPVPAAEFAAELVRAEEGEDGDVSRIFVKGDLRREEVLDDEETGAISITRPDKGVVWTLMPDEQMYMTMPLMVEAAGIGSAKDLERLGTVKVLGKEELSGFDCEIREYQYGDTGYGAIKVWYSTSLEFPIKIIQQTPSGKIILEHRKIKVETVPDSMFEVPPGYVKMEIPGMGQMPAGMPKFPGDG